MTVFLMILKVIGKVLLCLLIILLTLLLAVLFIPVHYSLLIEKKADDDVSVKVGISWCLHLVNILINYYNELSYVVRITFIPVYKSENLRKNKKKRKEDISEPPAKESVNTVSEEKALQNTSSEDTEFEKSEESGDDLIVEDLSSDEFIDENEGESANFAIYRADKVFLNGDIEEGELITNEKDNENHSGIDLLSIFDKVLEFFGKIFDFLFYVDNKIEKISEKISDIIDNIEYYVDFTQDEKNRAVVSMCISRVLKVLKHIKPRYIKGTIHAGFTDSYTMGKMLSIYSILFPLIHDKIQMVPDYDNDIIEGRIKIKGRVMLAVVLWAGYKLYFNKDLRSMGKALKRE